MLLAVAALLAASCTQSPATRNDEATATARRVAQEFVDGYHHQFPEEAYEIGYPDTPMDRLGDRGAEALAAWQAREDSWLATLKQIDPAQFEGTDAAIPYAFTRDRLEASVARRVCRTDLWNVSPTWTGWQSMLASTFAQQPVGTEAERAAALARLQTAPRYFDTETANLRAGMADGYLAPSSNVRAVLDQVQTLLDGASEASPFEEPASRTDDEAFRRQVHALAVESINPAIRRYRNFLAGEYRSRDTAGVAANPNGATCYAASVRFHTSLSLDPRAIHESGLREMQRIEGEMARIAHEYFGTDDVKGLLERLRTDRQYTFRSEAEVIAYARAAAVRAQVRVHDWFGFVHGARRVVRPFPAYQKASGGGQQGRHRIDRIS